MRKPRGLNGVFAVVPDWSRRQESFTIAEHAAILVMLEWPTALDQADDVVRFGGQECG